MSQRLHLKFANLPKIQINRAFGEKTLLYPPKGSLFGSSGTKGLFGVHTHLERFPNFSVVQREATWNTLHPSEDKAFERRFVIVELQEPSEALTGHFQVVWQRDLDHCKHLVFLWLSRFNASLQRGPSK